ncbi:putative TIR domain, AAA+ ATPase domain, P-loop containing nucleoside triphosphate hydrolase [Arabidopsis thaliana]|uniref:ADP-ribosyl cyclase/cyclic ADP-ribose hydrolase n=1 Tax=Arabidopsis thaliana x Arabidopsis arenosa TaxID=1240361 RepID=A0A8T2FJD4_9BRAS|nr:P-loop containing nucleoside triphosphate hydrolase [Arabidopsis thaliana x Arabidopsis arenosa]
MDFYVFLGTVAATFFTLLSTIFYMIYGKFRVQETIITTSSSPPTSPQSSLSCNQKHDVFPSFHGADVRKAFLSHILKEFKRKGIDTFIDNNIERSKSIGPELIEAIRGSKIAVVLLSKDYASSSWCLNELVEIMKCRKMLDQTVMTIFYEVDPTDVKKQTGDFGKVFKKTCMGKTNKVIRKWIEALSEVATIAGEHSRNWDNEAAMIEKISTDISNKLNKFTPVRDFDGLVGMGAHMEKLELLLCLDSCEVRMIGIWGPPGIGKTTIVRFLYNQLSSSFELSIFMENIKTMHTILASSDDYSAKLILQRQFLSKILDHKDIEIPHLRVLQERLYNKKVLVVLDDVDQSVQLDALAKETRWFGPRSRILITTQDRKLLKAHRINNIYKVDLPNSDDALQIFCMYAFGQKTPYDGFYKLAREVTSLVGELPLGLRVVGSYFREMSKQEWKKEISRLSARLDGKIESILKFSYDALCDEDKDLFLHIACFFNHGSIEALEDFLGKTFLDIAQRLHVLAEKSLISINSSYVKMHDSLVQLGREIVRKQSVREPGQRQFIVDVRDIFQVLADDTAGGRSVIGIDLYLYQNDDVLNISEKAFEGMSNLQFLRFRDFGNREIVCLPHSLTYLSQKLRLLHWDYFPMTCFPSKFNPEFLVELNMRWSKLEKLWEEIQPLRNLKRMILSNSRNLKELPDLSSATNLEVLTLNGCSSLVELPFSIGYAINLQRINLSFCSNLVELPSSIGNATNLKELHLTYCSSLMELPSSIGNCTNLKMLDLSLCSNLIKLPSSIRNAIKLEAFILAGCESLKELPSFIGKATNLMILDLRHLPCLVELPSFIGNLHKLTKLSLRGCKKLQVLPTNINLEFLDELDLTDCILLKTFPAISTNIKRLYLRGTQIEEVSSSLRSWPRLQNLQMVYSENLSEFSHVLERITVLELRDINIREMTPWLNRITRLRRLKLSGCGKLVSLPQLPDSLTILDADNCGSLERLGCSFNNPNIRHLDFTNCLKLDKEARDLIIQATARNYSILPSREVHEYITNRAIGNSLTVKLNQRALPTSMRFKACIVLADKGDHEASNEGRMEVCLTIMERQNDFITSTCVSKNHSFRDFLTEHLYTFEVLVDVEVTSDELVFDFKLNSEKWEIGECGVLELKNHVQTFSEIDSWDNY